MKTRWCGKHLKEKYFLSPLIKFYPCHFLIHWRNCRWWGQKQSWIKNVLWKILSFIIFPNCVKYTKLVCPDSLSHKCFRLITTIIFWAIFIFILIIVLYITGLFSNVFLVNWSMAFRKLNPLQLGSLICSSIVAWPCYCDGCKCHFQAFLP